MRGIYGFKNKVTNKWYIGQSINVEARFVQHILDSLKNDSELVKFHKALKRYPFELGYWEFHIFENNEGFTKEQLNKLEAQYINLYDAKNSGYNSTKGNHAQELCKIAAGSMNFVSQKKSHEIWKTYRLYNHFGSKILIVGQFKLAQSFIMNDNEVTIISDNFAYKEDGANIIRVNNKGELEMAIKNLGDKYFDLILMNPPYEIGNEITQAIIKNVNYETFIDLMPIGKFKKDHLYKHIVPTSIIHSSNTTEFSKVYTTPICAKISKTQLFNIEYEEFELKYFFDQRLRRFWDEQIKRKKTYYSHNVNVLVADANKFSSKTCYSCGIYTPNIMQKNGPKTIKNNDGTFKTNDRYYIWNFLKPEGSLDQYFEGNSCYTNQTVTVFNTEQEADNFKNWVHSGELSGKGRLRGLFSILLRAMNKPTACPFPYAIPNVDWSRPWTDEEILKDYGYSDEEIEEILHFNDDIK